jgi:hypothetical protein
LVDAIDVNGKRNPVPPHPSIFSIDRSMYTPAVWLTVLCMAASLAGTITDGAYLHPLPTFRRSFLAL